MSGSIPKQPKLYHIVHVDRLPAIVGSGHLFCDAEVRRRQLSGTTIGMHRIKATRLERTLSSRHGLRVGDCVPFYFCPRSVMLYLLYQGNHPDLDYRGGQTSILHLEADLHQVVNWANECERRWAFTTSNAGSYYFDDYCDLGDLGKIDWEAVWARNWQQHKEHKQAEFLVEHSFPWELVERIGVHSKGIGQKVLQMLSGVGHRPVVQICKDWYY